MRFCSSFAFVGPDLNEREGMGSFFTLRKGVYERLKNAVE